MKMPFTKDYVDQATKSIIAMHDTIIKTTGGELGIRDQGGLEHAIYTFLNAKEKSDGIHVCATIYKMFASRHYFVDGNKRIAHVFAKAWLFMSNIHFKTPYKEAVRFIMEIAINKKSLQDIEKWIVSNSEKIEGNVDNYVENIIKEIKDMSTS